MPGELFPPSDGLNFPPSSTDELPNVLRPQADGGSLERRGMVEVVSSLRRDGSSVGRDLRWGVFVTFAAHDEYVLHSLPPHGTTASHILPYGDTAGTCAAASRR